MEVNRTLLFYAYMIYKGLNINRTVNIDYYNNKCVKV